jgi:acetyl esterase/lipase
MLAAIVTQQMLKQKLQLPKLQVLIYPRLQFYTYRLPSTLFYADKTLMDSRIKTAARNIWRYIGLSKITGEMEALVNSNSHSLVIKDPELIQEYDKYMSLDLIPDAFKSKQSYYKDPLIINQNPKINANNSILRNYNVRRHLMDLMGPDASPSLANDQVLKQLPKTYFLVLEWDTLKDQALIFSERLKHNGVPVHIDFYEDCCHGIFNMFDVFDRPVALLDQMASYIRTNI